MNAGPVKNVCGPENIYGPFEHMLFLGSSVRSFTATAGWNGQQSEISVLLVDDDCPPPPDCPKKYYDCLLEKQDWTDPDPGFYGTSLDIIGSAVYFRIGDFEFSGIVQNWEEIHGLNDKPTYRVTIVDPSQLLQNSQLIINEYTGNVASIYNIFNLYGYLESFGVSCPGISQVAPQTYSAIPPDDPPDGWVFGSEANAYGGANANLNGLQWLQMLLALKRLTSSNDPAGTIVPHAAYSPYGRIIFRAPGPVPTECMGIMDSSGGPLTDYYLDLEDMPTSSRFTPFDDFDHWRFNGLNVSILDVITQICEDAVHDYYIELLPVLDELVLGPIGNPRLHLFIKVRTVDRWPTPTANTFDTFLAGASDNEIINYNKGFELRNETTESFVVGGPKQSLYQVLQATGGAGTADDVIVPFFGLDPTTGDVILPTQDANGFWEYFAYTDDIAFQLANARYGIALPATILLNEKELIMAQAGFDAWETYASFHNTPLWAALGLTRTGVLNADVLADIMQNAPAGNQPAPWVAKAFRNDAFTGHGDFEKEISNIAFSWVSKIANEYYGRQYQVRVPHVCNKIDLESLQVLSSEEPTDGGWTSEPDILGLAHPSIATDFFQQPDYRTGALVRFDNANGLEASNLNVNDFVSDGTNLWLKISVQTKNYEYLDKSALLGPRAIITLPQQMRRVNTFVPSLNWNLLWAVFTDFGAGVPVSVANANTDLPLILGRPGGIDLHEGSLNRAEMPDGVAFGIKSNVLTYGPWGAISGTPGAVKVVHDEGLVPWEYGGFTVLDDAAESIALEGVSEQQVAEEGEVTLVGYPNIPLGAELLSAQSGPFAGGAGVNLFENRSAKTFTINTVRCVAIDGFVKWDGTHGPNITGISVVVDPQSGAKTTYTIRTWTQKWGKLFRGNAERLKRIGTNILKVNKQIRAWNFQRFRNGQLAFLDRVARNQNAAGGGGVGGDMGGRTGSSAPATNPMLAGQDLTWKDGDAHHEPVTQLSVDAANLELADNYADKAMMSLDGLLRPISTTTAGDLSKYANPIGACLKTLSRGAQPPIDKPGEAGQLNQYNFDVDITNLDPVTNPTSTLITNKNDNMHGHDVSVLARGTTPPTDHMGLREQYWADSTGTDNADYQSNYRYIALRGPVMIKGWGYDTDGFPIPNKVDVEANAKDGTFSELSLQNKFMDDFLQKPQAWPVAPLDVRYDRDRAVWTIPQYRDIVVELKEDIAPLGSGSGEQISGPILYDTGGVLLTNPAVYVNDQVNAPHSSGDRVIATFDPAECIYRIVEARSTQNKFIDYDCCVETGTRIDNECICPTTGSIVLANGLRAFSGSNTGICPVPPAAALGCGSSVGFFMQAGIEIESVTGLVNDFANHFVFGTGLVVTTGANDCTVIIDTSSTCLSLINTTECPTGNTDFICPSGPLAYEIGGGLVVETGATSGNALWAAGMNIARTTSCVTGTDTASFANTFEFGRAIATQTGAVGSCTVSFDAGFNFAQTGVCVTGTEGITFANKVNLGGGLFSESGSDCDITLGAGTTVRVDNTKCISDDDFLVLIGNPLSAINDFEFGKGFKAASGDSGVCSAKLNAGIEVSTFVGCLPVNQNVPQLASEISIGRGFVSETGANDCTMLLDAGIALPYSGAICVTGTNDIPFANKIALGQGLFANVGADCDATIGAGMQVVDTDTMSVFNHRNIFNFGNGLTAVASGNCGVTITASGGVCIALTNVNDCPSGSMDFSCTGAVPYDEFYIGAGLIVDSTIDAGGVLWSAGMDIQRTTSCITGTDTTSFANAFQFGRAISTATGVAGDCSVGLDAGFEFLANNTCVTGTEVDTFVNKLTLGKGIYSTTGGDCDITLGAGWSVTVDDTQCIDQADKVSNGTTFEGVNDMVLGMGFKMETGATDCDYLLNAGIIPEVSAALCVTGATLNTDLVSTLEFGRGMHVQPGSDDCTLQVGAGFSIVNEGSTCITVPTNPQSVNEVTLGKGLRGAGTDCDVTFSAGIEVGVVPFANTINFVGDFEVTASGACGVDVNYTGSDCIEVNGGVGGCPTSNDTIACLSGGLNLGDGLALEDQGGGFGLLGAGMQFNQSTNCITDSDTLTFANNITLARGLFSSTGNCSIEIGAGISIGGQDPVNQIVLGGGLTWTNGGSCIGVLALACDSGLVAADCVQGLNGITVTPQNNCGGSCSGLDIRWDPPCTILSCVSGQDNITATPVDCSGGGGCGSGVNLTLNGTGEIDVVVNVFADSAGLWQTKRTVKVFDIQGPVTTQIIPFTSCT